MDLKDIARFFIPNKINSISNFNRRQHGREPVISPKMESFVFEEFKQLQKEGQWKGVGKYCSKAKGYKFFKD